MVDRHPWLIGVWTVAILGLFFFGLASAITWSEKRYRLWQATTAIEEVYEGVRSYALAPHHTFGAAVPSIPQGLAPFEPGPECGCQSGRFCPENAHIWEADPVWRALRFSRFERHRYRISYRGEGDNFVIRVRFDADCDGTLGELTARGALAGVKRGDKPEIVRVNEKE